MANEVVIDIAVETRKARQSVERLEKSFEGFAKTAKKETDKATGALDVFAGTLSADVFRSFFSNVVSGFFEIGSASLDAASDAEETASKFSTVFRDIEDSAQSAADNLAKSYGLASSEARKLLGDTGDLLTGFGFAQDQALDLSTQVQELAVDLASFTNFSGGAAGASEALTKALLGERESVKALGISIQETDVQRQVAIDRANGVTFATEREAKAYATLQIAVRQSGNAIGDFARTQNQLANQQRILDANIQTTTENFGKGLIPAFTTLTISANKLLTQNQDLVKTFGDLAGTGIDKTIDFLVQSIVPLGEAVVFTNKIFVGLLTTWDFVDRAINDLIGSFANGALSALELARSAKEALGLDTSGLDRQINAIKNFSEANREASQEISDQIDERLEKQDEFAAKVRDIAKVSQEAAASQIASARAVTQVTTEENEKRTQSNQQATQTELTEKQKLAEESLKIQKEQAEKSIQIRAQQQAQLNQLIAEQKALEAEEKKIEVELEAEETDARLEELINILGREEAIRSEAEARRLESEGKVADARKKRREADLKAEKENIFALQKFEDLSQKQRVANVKSTLGQISTLQKSGSKELAVVGKAAAISQATIDGFAAVQKALASAPPPVNFALAGLVGTATAINVGKIASAPLPSFQDGGIVPGVPSNVDNTTANVASGEVILNRRQQAETLFAIANGQGGGSGQPMINVNVESGVLGPTSDQIDNLVDEINNSIEFRNNSLRTA